MLDKTASFFNIMRASLIAFIFLIVLTLGLGACIPMQPGPPATITTRQPGMAEQPLQSTITPSPLPTNTPDILQGTITLWHSLSDNEIQTIVRVIVDFQNLYPDTQFDVLYLPQNILLDRYKNAVQENRGPSMLIGPADWGPELSGGGWVQDLGDRLSPELAGRLNQAALQSGLVKRNDPENAVQVGLPFIMEGVVLFRNNDLIPDIAASWDDLLSQAQLTTQGDVIGAYLDRSFFFSGGHLEGLGGSLMHPDGTPAFNSEKGLEWVGLLQSFEEAGAADFLTDSDVERFKEQRVGYLIELTANRETIADAIGSQNLSVDRWPSFGDGNLSGFVFPEMIYLNNQADTYTQRLAWMFAEFLLEAQSQKYFAEIGRIPVVLDAPVDDMLIVQSVKALQDAVVSAPPELAELYRTALDEALLMIFSGYMSPQEGLANAEAIILEALGGNQPVQSP
jgi:ABC-type glycerol-3-phosphate transport system substrate-binding protein